MAQHGLLLGGFLLHAPPPPETVAEEAVLEDEEDGGEAVGSDDGGDELTDHETSDYGDETSDDEEEDDEEEEESDFQDSFDVSAQLLQSVLPRKFLGPSAPRFAAAGNTAGFMRVVTAATDAENPGGGGGDRQIIHVLYRYTRFSAAWSDGSVEARGSTREHQLRFIVAACHGERSLAWAGASMSQLIYPGGRSSINRLRKLWSGLIADASIPPHATRVEAFVDVGIIRPADCARESMESMCAALEDTMTQPWPGRFTGMELHLPEPVRRRHDEDKTAAHDDDDRPAKRRRGVDCGVCLEVLEGDDLAAWPGCGKPHVFHGACMESVLENDLACPICRHKLYSEPKF